MIIPGKETQAKTSLIDLLGGNSKNSSSSKSNDLFSKLLASFGMQTKSVETKIIQSNDFKTIIDPKNIPPKVAANLSTALNANLTVKNSELKTSELKELQTLLKGDNEQESGLISKELLGTLSNDQVRSLIHRAKEYLKTEITTKAPEYTTEAKTLPKTLAGLVQLAEKMGLAPQSISLSTIISDPEEQVPFPAQLLSKSLLETKTVAALSMIPEIEKNVPFEAIAELLSQIKNKETKQPKETQSLSLEPAEKAVSQKGEVQPLKALLQQLDKPVQESATTTPAEAVKSTASAPTQLKGESLLTLLQGNSETKESKAETNGALKVETDSSKNIHLPKADSIEVKSKEASQSMRLFAADLKEAVQEYKPPFTRLTMKLNPEKLGEVEVTLVQRGNNVHVNIQSSNSNSVAFLAHNATELKAQLASQGITNATMNFMSGGEGQTGQQAQQQHHEQRQNLFRSYASFEELELNEEQVSALEIILPHYA